jgi:ABC-type nitrate/sulfonate/bicarbonate transport system substrate-binding protein
MPNASRWIVPFVVACAALVTASAAAIAQTDVRMIGFGGANNLVVWIGIDKGLYAKEGLRLTLDRTPGSREQMRDMMEGKYHIATTAFDNIVAYTEGQGRDNLPDFDVVSIMGAQNGFNSVVVAPDIKTYADIRGKALAVDSPKSGYATMMYEIIRRKTGMEQGKDYEILQVGGTGARVKALKEGKAAIAAISSPDDQQLQAAGFRILGDAALEIGAYQGSTYAVRRSWAKNNEATVLALVRATVAATEWLVANRAGAIEVLRSRVKGLDEATAGIIYDGLMGPGGMNRRAELNLKGIDTVLGLRRQAGNQAGEPARYIDTSYYAKAMKK